MTVKICVLLIAFFLFQNGQTFRLNSNSNEEINEDTVNMIQNVFIKRYPQAAIDKYISVMRQLYSKVPEEKKEGNFESVVLMVEGTLYQTERERRMASGNSLHYDVRSALNRLEDANDSDEDSEEFNEKKLEAAINDLDKEFPKEVGQKIASIFTRVLKAETLEDVKKAAIDLTILSMDGARVITNRSKTLPTATI